MQEAPYLLRQAPGPHPAPHHTTPTPTHQTSPAPSASAPPAVARRLSEQAERRRSVHTPSTGGSGLAGAPPGGAPGSASQPGGAAGGEAPHPHPYGRVIDFIAESDEDLAGEEGADVAVVRVLSGPHGIPPTEATGSR